MLGKFDRTKYQRELRRQEIRHTVTLLCCLALLILLICCTLEEALAAPAHPIEISMLTASATLPGGVTPPDPVGHFFPVEAKQ